MKKTKEPISRVLIKELIDKCNHAIWDLGQQKGAENSYMLDLLPKYEKVIDEIIYSVFPQDPSIGALQWHSGYAKEGFYKCRDEMVQDFNILNNKLRILLGDAEMYLTKHTINTNKKIFISHASLDKDFVKKFIKILQTLGISKDDIFCSSIEGINVKTGLRSEVEIQKEIINNSIIIYILTKNFYDRPACLHELGAGWVLSDIQEEKTVFLLKMPNLSHDEFKGMFSNSFQYLTIESMTGFVDNIIKCMNLKNHGTQENLEAANELRELMNKHFTKTIEKDILAEVADFSKSIKRLSKIEKLIIAKLYHSDNWECNLMIKDCIELEAKRMIKMLYVSQPTADYRLTDDFIDFIKSNGEFHKELLQLLVEEKEKRNIISRTI